MLWGCCLTLSGLSTVDVGVLSKGSFVLDEAEAVFTGVEGKFASDEAFQRSIHDAAAGFASDPLTTMDTPLHALIRISADHDVSTASVRAWEARVMKATDATSAAKAFAFGEYLGAHPAKNPARNPHVHHFMTPATPAQLVALAALPQIESFVLVPAELKVAPDLWAEIATPKSAASDYVHLLVGLTDGHLASQDEAGAVARAVQASIDALPSVAAATLTSVAASLPLPIASHHAADRLSVANISRALLADVVRSVALHAEVTWVEEQPHYEYSNRFAHALQQSGGTAATVAGGASGVAGDSPLWDAGLHGEGEVVGVGDSGLDHMSCYFYDAANPLTITPNEINNFPAHSKVVQYVPFASTGEDEDGGHGTHVCGSVAGRGSGQCDLIEDDGMAYAAKLAFFDIGQPGAQGLNVPQSLRTQMFPPSYDVGARIHTNSWGANTNRYSLNSRDVDAYSFEKQDYLVLVAAGNSGSEGLGSVGSPATAKSCMSIGASSSPTASFALVGANTNDPNVADQHQVIADFSSLGPGADGRRGITLLSPGFYTISANSDANPTPGHTGLTVKAGTSMATPVTAGYAALVRQYFRMGYYPLGAVDASRGFIPRGALIEAMIVNSAQHMTGTFAGIAANGDRTNARTAFNTQQRPSVVQGFGRFQLDRAMRLASSKGNWISLAVGALDDTASEVETGDAVTFTIKGVESTDGAGVNIALKVTLVWHDPAGQTGAAKSLVNDLDLTVTTPNGQTVLPQTEGDGPLTVGATTGKDDLNTVEQVVIATPTAGDYTITVLGTSVPQGPQPFALVATWGTGSVTAGDASGENAGTIANGLGITVEGGGAKTSPSAGEVVLILFAVCACIAVVAALIGGVVLFVVVAKKRRGVASDGALDHLQASHAATAVVTGAKRTGPKKGKKNKTPPPMPPKKRKPRMPPKPLMTVRAKWGYEGAESDELTFDDDAIITVLDTSDSDWHKGRLADGRTGMYPAAYVVPN